jgi:hypothetical protein
MENLNLINEFVNAVIKLRAEELDYNLLQKIKELVNGRDDIEVTISLSNDKSEYFKTLDHSIADLNANKDTISFTMEEFLEYPSSKLM